MTESRLVHIVDDEDAIRRSLDFLLRAAGFRAVRWESGVAFLKGVDPNEPACVVMDVRMPGMDGLEVQGEMRERGINLPVILLTGHGDVAMAVRAMHAGAVDFLEKPVERDTLLRALEAAFEQVADHEAKLVQTEWAQTQIAKLTEREREVLDGLACGYPNKTIAYDLGISSRTVEVYRAKVMTKLGVANFADVLRVAFAGGLGSERAWRQKYDVAATR